MLGRGNWNSFTFRELKNNVKIMTMRGWCFWHSLNAPRKRGTAAAAVQIQQEETEGGEKRHTQNLQCTFTRFSLSSSTIVKENVYAERRMKCDVSSGQMRAHFHETLAESACTFLKWASMSGLLSHISVRRTTDVWRTPAEEADGLWVSAALYTPNHQPDHRTPVLVLKVGVKREK